MRKACLLALAASLAAQGCVVPPPSYEAMIPAAYDTPDKHPQSVSLAVSGGQESAPARPHVSDAAFAQALAEAIARSGTFSKVVQGAAGDYVLSVTLFGQEQPTGAFLSSYMVRMEAGWTLRRSATGAIVWQKSVRSEGIGRTGDSTESQIYSEARRAAVESAARNNISQGLAEISRLKL